MANTEKTSLFTSLTVADSATVCGGILVVKVNNFPKTELDLYEQAKRLGLNPQIVQYLKKELLANR